MSGKTLIYDKSTGKTYIGSFQPESAVAERGSDRILSTWLSHRDCVQLVWRSIEADVRFGIYYGISGMGAICHTINPRLPAEQHRLFDLIGETGAKGVVFVSGDRHTAFLYRSESALPYPAYELTASSLNVSFSEATPEQDTAQIGEGFPPENYGAIDIDWETGSVGLSIKNADGETVRQTTAQFR